MILIVPQFEMFTGIGAMKSFSVEVNDWPDERLFKLAALKLWHVPGVNTPALVRSMPASPKVDEMVPLLAVVPACVCGGPLKPDVVFFGENVPADRVARCYAAVEALGTGGALLVAGSSLTVMSGLRFVKRAAAGGTPIVIVNRGVTRGDELASYKLEEGCSEFLTTLAGRAA